jgi:hypothetical protein
MKHNVHGYKFGDVTAALGNFWRPKEPVRQLEFM